MIESINNDRIKNFTKLNKKKYRDEQSLFLVEGNYLVIEALKHNLVVEIFLLSGEENHYGEVTYVTIEILKKLSNLNTPPKVIAICKKPPKDVIKGNVIMLDSIADPGNLGTIIRSAVAFNYETIIISPDSVDLYNSKVIRATEGMVFNINIVIDDLNKVISELKTASYQIFGTDVKEGCLPMPVKTKHAIIIGSESIGIKQNILNLCDRKLMIKMNPLCESLNAGVSASILMYELNK